MPYPIDIDEQQNQAIRAEIGERLRTIDGLAGRQRVPRSIRQSLDRLDEIEHQIELKTFPSIAPAGKEGWLRRLFLASLRLRSSKAPSLANKCQDKHENDGAD